ncbi:tryptophan--tRNA ligase [bacterium]|nr:tryptophan--tRNA ligase [bacterium]
MNKETVLSGIRATGRLHFGNFLGAVRNFVEHQAEGNRCLYFVADLHTLTTLDDPEELRKNLLEIVTDYLAAGLDPEQSVIYAQSSVPETVELFLYLSMFQPLGDLQRVPTFKDLVKRNPDRVSLGLVSYPVLMAADILGPQATLVPCGEDQVPNVEMARSIARRFNSRFGDVFAEPRMLSEMVKVPGLDGGKMGKSDASNAVDINLPIAEIGNLYKKRGVTDPARRTRTDPGDPYHGCKSVYPVHELITPGEKGNREIAHACQSASIGCGECKTLLIESLASVIEPFQERRRELAKKRDYVEEVLVEGGKTARAMIKETTEQVRDLMGIRQY